ncbi:MAG TPA: selenide, water dikinase SelD [Pseudomonadales bacterium]|jgi:selenide,water dikinase
MQLSAPPVRDLVLVGGGHSHVQVLKSFGMRPVPGTRLTLVSREVYTPYSGMLPGYVAGFYDWHDIHIDLGALASFAGARLIVDEVTGADLDGGRLRLAAHPDLHYDLLSINVGAVPRGVGQGVPVKPIGRFLPQLERVREEAGPGTSIAVVGGGAGGVELALAMSRTMPHGVEVKLVTDELLPGYPAGVVRRLEKAVLRSGVVLIRDFRALDCRHGLLESSDGRSTAADHAFWVTGVMAASWPAAAGLATDVSGFIEVDRCLRSTSHESVYAAGDVACLIDQPRPKSGVYAVREGPALTRNLRRAIVGRPGIPFRAQKRFLSLIGTADGSAVAARGPWAASGRWAWRWKDWIDRRFVARFNRLPVMTEPGWSLPESLRDEAPDAMRCGGCGAKLGASPLMRVLERLPPQVSGNVRVGIGDDAAILGATGGETILTVDGFRSLVSDPYLFGRITAHHALNDIIAMGGKGTAALAMASVPLMSEALMEEDLFQLLRGAVDVLNAHEVPLVGGHSSEGAELSLGLTVAGVPDGPTLTKGGAEPGDALVLTKPLGTGSILAGQMRGAVRSDSVSAAIASMDASNASALVVFRRYGIHAATDVSGFGLLGHLGEMLRASALGVRLDLNAVPFIEGAVEAVSAGAVSSLQDNNELALADFALEGCEPGDATVRLLVDPQTSGGLLGCVPEAEAEACVRDLREVGYPRAAVIGRVLSNGWTVTAEREARPLS